MVSIVIFIIILAVLILAHEFGHFITAKKTGVAIEEFGLGFPPRLFGKKGKDGVFYSINLIPLGGFVKLKGESGEYRDDPDSFVNRPIRVRALIIAAGVIMNVIVAYLLFSVGFMFGLPTIVGDDQLNDPGIKNIKVQIASVVASSPAQLAGIQIGDQILSINGQTQATETAYHDFIGQHSQDELTLKILRQEQISEVKVRPQEIEGFAAGKVLGVTLIQTGIVRHNFFTSWYYGLLATGNVIILVVLAFFNLFKDLLTGLGLSPDLSGPVGVAVMTGQVVSLGWVYVLQFMALLSLNLAVINFFPFPALDGGRFLFLIIEKIRRQAVSQKIENIIHSVGFTLLILLILAVTYRDIVRFGGGFIERVKNIFT